MVFNTPNPCELLARIFWLNARSMLLAAAEPDHSAKQQNAAGNRAEQNPLQRLHPVLRNQKAEFRHRFRADTLQQNIAFEQPVDREICKIPIRAG